jgi:general nucleoside transport system permease protein
MTSGWDAIAGNFLVSALRSSTPLLWVLLGEILTQRVAIVNLGVEGQMLAGALAGFAAALATGDPWLGLAAGAGAGMLLSTVHAGLAVGLKANPFASGLAVWMLGFGLSAFYGIPMVGQKIAGFAPLPLGFLARVPVLGPIASQLTPTVALALLASPLAGWWLYRTRTGLAWRAVGESLVSARTLGFKTSLVQVAGIVAGGAFSGFGGAALSVDYTRNWVEGMTAGRGLVAVGLVIVARWNPFLAVPAALLFGGAEALTLRLQTAGVPISSHLLHTLPYLASLAVLVASTRSANKEGGMPAGLSAVFTRSR